MKARADKNSEVQSTGVYQERNQQQSMESDTGQDDLPL